MSICGWAAGGRWEFATATGRGEARAGAAGSVGTAGGLVVHGGAGVAATVRDQVCGAARGGGHASLAAWDSSEDTLFLEKTKKTL